jgi:hypothetical protein
MTALLLLAAASFSHALHVKIVPECAACHPKAAASTSVGDSLLPDKSACARCHRDRIPAYKRQARPAAPLARFSHATHVKIVRCEDCHHAGAPAQMAGCIVCHSEVSPPDSCVFCHAKNAKLTPTSHTPEWLDVHSSGKVKLDEEACALCHGRNFTCEGCH